MARWARDAGVILRFIEYMDVGHTNGWRMDEVVPADELVATRRRGDAARGRAAALSRARSHALPLPRRRRRDRAHRVGDAAVLRRLHPGPDLAPRALLHLPVHGGGPRPAGDPARPGLRRRRRRPMRPCAMPSPPSGGSATTATPSSGPRRRRRGCRGSRCSRWAAEARSGRSLRGRHALVHASSTSVQNSWILVGAVRPSSWTSPLTLREPAVP